MNYDIITNCNRCGGDMCYKQEISPEITLKMCLSCGFQCNTLMKKDSKFYNEQMEILPELHKELSYEDEEGSVWIPSTLQVEGKGMVFADGTSKDNWVWAAAKDVKVQDDEKEKYNNKEWRTDMTTAKRYNEEDYIEALDYLGLLTPENLGLKNNDN